MITKKYTAVIAIKIIVHNLTLLCGNPKNSKTAKKNDRKILINKMVRGGKLTKRGLASSIAPSERPANVQMPSKRLKLISSKMILRIRILEAFLTIKITSYFDDVVLVKFCYGFN